MRNRAVPNGPLPSKLREVRTSARACSPRSSLNFAAAAEGSLSHASRHWPRTLTSSNAELAP